MGAQNPEFFQSILPRPGENRALHSPTSWGFNKVTKHNKNFLDILKSGGGLGLTFLADIRCLPPRKRTTLRSHRLNKSLALMQTRRQSGPLSSSFSPPCSEIWKIIKNGKQRRWNERITKKDDQIPFFLHRHPSGLNAYVQRAGLLHSSSSLKNPGAICKARSFLVRRIKCRVFGFIMFFNRKNVILFWNRKYL